MLALQPLMTEMHVQRGTLDYMAPELMAYDDDTTQQYPITSAVDVYSFGLVLWQIITAEVPNRAAGALRMPRCPSVALPPQLTKLVKWPRQGLPLVWHACSVSRQTWSTCSCRSPEECPADIVTLYQACLCTDPRERPTAAELVQRLRL